MADIEELDQLKYRLRMCIRLLNEYSWLLDCYILDFFTENHMKKLPKSWRKHIRNISVEDFYYLLDLSVKSQTIWPLSIISLRILINFLQVPRKLIGAHHVGLIESNKIDITKIQELSKINSVCFEYPNLRNYFLKHVKPKKRYEIFKMATVTKEIADKLNVKYIVDVGSGLGHLSRILAYGFDLRVCSIETQSQLTKQAEKLDCEFEKISSKYLSESALKDLKSRKPVQMNQTVTCNLTANEFVEGIKRAFSMTEKNFTFGIVGLHPCGDLAAVLLKLYSNCSEAKFINLVGCCYHKLSTSCDSEYNTGFPLTSICRENASSISYEARALACHAIESYRQRLVSKTYSHLKVHCYRAALENLINKNWPEHRKSALCNVKSVPELTFSEYCESALKKLNLTIPQEELKSEETIRNLSCWKDVVKFYSLRLMLAPLIESAILLDRKIFLMERGFQCKINAAFDPEISPRNQLLISQKHS